MKPPRLFRSIATALVLGVALLGGCVSGPTRPETNVTAFYEYQQSTAVMLMYRKGDSPELFPIGTAGIVGTQGSQLLILTARHCVNDLLVQPNYHLYVVKDDKAVRGTIVSDYIPNFGARQDYAFVVCDDELGRVRANGLTSRDPVLGERVWVSPVFPWMGIPTTLEGRVASISEDKSLMIIQVQGYYGMSGSNVVDAGGKVLGVLIAVQTHGQEHTPIGGTSLCVVVRAR